MARERGTRGGRVVRARAFAKVNLSLRVLGVRPDGYHELRTTFQSLALHDTLTLTPARGPLRIECNNPACPVNRTNLVWRAAERMWRASGRRGAPRGFRVVLTKRIPLRAGLGGGSSDAAAALRAFAFCWDVRASRERLQSIAAGLGADVPFFLDGGSSLGVERGDVLFPLIDAPASWVVLVLPEFGVSTSEAYGWFDEVVASSSRPRGAASALPLPAFDLRNDLEAPVAERYPSIRRFIGALRRHGASYAAMSGSGSAVFGLFDARRTADMVARALAGPGRRTLVTRTIGRREYGRRARPEQGQPT